MRVSFNALETGQPSWTQSTVTFRIAMIYVTMPRHGIPRRWNDA